MTGERRTSIINTELLTQYNPFTPLARHSTANKEKRTKQFVDNLWHFYLAAIEEQKKHDLGADGALSTLDDWFVVAFKQFNNNEDEKTALAFLNEAFDEISINLQILMAMMSLENYHNKSLWSEIKKDKNGSYMDSLVSCARQLHTALFNTLIFLNNEKSCNFEFASFLGEDLKLETINVDNDTKGHAKNLKRLFIKAVKENDKNLQKQRKRTKHKKTVSRSVIQRHWQPLLLAGVIALFTITAICLTLLNFIPVIGQFATALFGLSIAKSYALFSMSAAALGFVTITSGLSIAYSVADQEMATRTRVIEDKKPEVTKMPLLQFVEPEPEATDKDMTVDATLKEIPDAVPPELMLSPGTGQEVRIQG